MLGCAEVHLGLGFLDLGFQTERNVVYMVSEGKFGHLVEFLFLEAYFLAELAEDGFCFFLFVLHVYYR